MAITKTKREKNNILITTNYNVGDVVFHKISGKLYHIIGITICNKSGTRISYIINNDIDDHKVVDDYEIGYVSEKLGDKIAEIIEETENDDEDSE